MLGLLTLTSASELPRVPLDGNAPLSNARADAPLLLRASARRHRHREPAPRGCVLPALPPRCDAAASPRRAMREPSVLGRLRWISAELNRYVLL
jgi:hypothetical protein